ncbi:MAG TPA: hypothetical protein VIV08_07120 [Acidimicrobiia bacterium]
MNLQDPEDSAYRRPMNQTWMIPVILVIVALLLVFALIGIFS